MKILEYIVVVVVIIIIDDGDGDDRNVKIGNTIPPV